MPNLRNDYTEGVGKTVLDLFKKVFQVKKEHVDKEAMKSQINTQTGGDDTEIKVEELDQEYVKLTKVEQYYDGTIYEGILNYNATYDILFNIKDRTTPLQTVKQQ
jgi:hypothetical protein